MFQLTGKEWEILKSQFVTSKMDNRGGIRKLPFAFTEHGAVMLASVLNSDRAIEVNIQIVRIFTKMKELLLTHKDILLKLEQAEKKMNKHGDDIELIFKYLKQLLTAPEPAPRTRIGFRRKGEND
jgi:phage regulator Rha-like protein